MKYVKKNICRGAWVAQVVKRPTLGFSSGHDLTVMRSSPASGSPRSVEPAWDSLSFPLALPHSLLSLKINEFFKKEIYLWHLHTVEFFHLNKSAFQWEYTELNMKRTDLSTKSASLSRKRLKYATARKPAHPRTNFPLKWDQARHEHPRVENQPHFSWDLFILQRSAVSGSHLYLMG